MDENKKSVKRVLVLDWQAIDLLAKLLLQYNVLKPVIFFEMLSHIVMSGDTPNGYSIDVDEFINVDTAELFFKAYGKEVEE